MKRLRHLFAAMIFASVLTVTATAGDISCGVYGEISCGVTQTCAQEEASSAGEMSAGVIETILTLMQGALLVF